MRMNSDPEIALVRISPGECIIADLEGERQCRSSRGWRDKCHGGGHVPRSPAMGRWKARGLKTKISEWEQQWTQATVFANFDAACYEIRTNEGCRSRGCDKNRRWLCNAISAVAQTGRWFRLVLKS